MIANATDAPALSPAEQRTDPGWGERGWRRRAACLTEDPELFFPIGTAGQALDQVARAKAVCARCPVRDACLRFAIDTGQGFGIWGGLTEDERRLQRRRRKAAAVRSGPGRAPDQLIAG